MISAVAVRLAILAAEGIKTLLFTARGDTCSCSQVYLAGVQAARLAKER